MECCLEISHRAANGSQQVNMWGVRKQRWRLCVNTGSAENQLSNSVTCCCFSADSERKEEERRSIVKRKERERDDRKGNILYRKEC